MPLTEWNKQVLKIAVLNEFGIGYDSRKHALSHIKHILISDKENLIITYKYFIN